MGEYRAGQRVRIEWPDGGLIEGVIGVSGYVCGVHPGLTSDGRVVTILAEPRPDEPTGLGAVVEEANGGLWIRADRGNLHPWREVLPGTYDEDDACRRTWKQIAAPVRVLSEGWQP